MDFSYHSPRGLTAALIDKPCLAGFTDSTDGVAPSLNRFYKQNIITFTQYDMCVGQTRGARLCVIAVRRDYTKPHTDSHRPNGRDKRIETA